MLRASAGINQSIRYDAPAGFDLWNATSFRMRLFDVGQSSALAAECEALASIADLLGKSQEAAVLRARWALLRDRVNANMWDDALRVCVRCVLSFVVVVVVVVVVVRGGGGGGGGGGARRIDAGTVDVVTP